MASLSLKNFSCLREADIELKQITILIGPQASGKSVISKLTYFFANLVLRPFFFSDQSTGLEEFQLAACAEFKKLFPPPAWGSAGFSIEFKSGPICMRVMRNKPKSTKSIGNLRISLGPFFEEFYGRLKKEIDEVKTKQQKSASKQTTPTLPWELTWRVQTKYRTELEKLLGQDDLGFLLFIPAGRALFTIMGKAIAAFDSDGFLDHFTREFGIRLLRVRDNSGIVYSYPHSDDQEMTTLREAFALQLFGGRLINERGDEYVEAADGRRIPFSVLSSGQQELYPLWEALKSLSPNGERSTTFIEEPEAHLFPSAQSQLVLFFAATLRKNAQRRMMITTHSPYVLAKLNNLIKASQLSQSQRNKASLVEQVIPRESWLRANSVAAYCIEDQVVKSIMDAGLIDAEYLDRVSGDIAEEFTRLLQIEAA